MITPTEWTRFKFGWLEQVMYAAELTPAARVVAFCIIQHCNMGTESGWPSLRRIETLTGISKKTVLAAIESLRANGYLEIAPGNPGRGHSNLYTPTLKGGETTPFTSPKRGSHSTFSSNATAPEKVKISPGKGGIVPRKGGAIPRKGGATTPEHLKNTFTNTLDNTVRSGTAPDEEKNRNEEKAVQRNGRASQQPPTGGTAERGSPEGTVTNVIHTTSPPTVPARSAPGKPSTFHEEKERLINVQRPIHEAYAKGVIGEAEYERRIAETEAAAQEDSTQLKAMFNPESFSNA